MGDCKKAWARLLIPAGSDRRKTVMRKKDGQRGIVIGPILFLIAIIGVLAAAIAAGIGGFGGSSSTASAKVMASAIIDYADTVKIGVDRVLANGCGDTEISFENPIVSGYDNPNAPADERCNVFSVNGGGIIMKTPPSQALDSSWLTASVPPPAGFFGTYVFMSVCGAHLGTGGGPRFGYSLANWPCCYDFSGVTAAESSELFLLLPWINEDVCSEINNKVGMKAGEQQRNGTIFWVKFKGQYGFGAGVGGGVIRVDKPSNTGKFQGCVDGANNIGVPGSAMYGGYYYFRALVIR